MTFWQWFSHVIMGVEYAAPEPLTTLEVINYELVRIHSQLESFDYEVRDDAGFLALVTQLKIY